MTLVFPALPGQGWSVKKTPMLSTRVASHVSGREVRAPLYARALYAFELTFNALDSTGDTNAGLGYGSLQTLMSFYLQCQGQYGTFVYVDPTDNFCGNAPFGPADGVTSTFDLMRPMGPAASLPVNFSRDVITAISYVEPIAPFSEPASYVTSLGPVTVNNAPVGATLVAPNQVSIGTPAAGAALAATFNYGFLCRFLSDSAEFENFMSGLWAVKSLKFRSVR